MTLASADLLLEGSACVISTYMSWISGWARKRRKSLASSLVLRAVGDRPDREDRAAGRHRREPARPPAPG